MTAEYVIGMDLGTTNSVMAYARLDAGESPEIQLFSVPQLTSPGTMESLASLPSFMYLAAEHEVRDRALDLPWAANRDFAVGQLARQQSAEVPDRSVGGAKSWLAYSSVDRHTSILPWNAPEEVAKVSPVAASHRYLQHLVDAWNRTFPDAPLNQQQVVLTVPASFDASARELTREAAAAAGLPSSFVLLEEPQAAVYAWLVDQGDRWRQQLTVGDRLLVCDVGGGTTDLTLIDMAQQSGELLLQRLAVGNHLLVGGDNMDLALAHFVAERFQLEGVSLDPWQAVSLWHACRGAKETMLAEGGPASHKVSVLGRGSRLIGGTVSVELDRQAAAELLTDGFFPACGLEERPTRRRQSGFIQLGLPFETDTAITRHIAAFLGAHAPDAQPAARPSHVLFNGGVFRAAGLRHRLLQVLGSWFPGQTVQDLTGRGDLDFAVARGAAYYGWAKQFGGVRIRGGTARSYYIGIETSGLAVPGTSRPLRALCVVPFGMEEGTQLDVPSQPIGLVLGEPAHFRFFSSSVRKHDTPGEMLERWDEGELQETDSMEAVLPASDAIEDTYVPVHFQSRVTELGVFELWCVGTQNDDRWKLEFSVREA